MARLIQRGQSGGPQFHLAFAEASRSVWIKTEHDCAVAATGNVSTNSAFGNNLIRHIGQFIPASTEI